MLLAAAVAGVVFVAAGRPLTDVAAVGGAALALVGVLAFVSRRAGRPVRRDAPHPADDPRRGRGD
ncbi:MAG: hypothetical protein ACODAF_09365 [Actinomycetota bacterium]